MAVPKFDLVRDDQGYAQAIAVDGYWLVHLQRGTVRNEENAAKLLAVLNAAVSVVNNRRPAWAGVSDDGVALEAALHSILPVRATK